MTEIRKRNRPTPTEKDTFDYSTPNLRVSAGEVNGYFERNPKVNDLAKALGLLPEMAKTAEQILEVQNNKAQEEGFYQRASGNMNIEGKTNAYLKGWDEMDGKANAIKFNEAAALFTEQNKDLNPSDFKKGFDALIGTFTEGKTKEFLKSFTPSALQTQAQVEMQMLERNTNKIKENELGTLALPLIQNATNQVIIDVFAENGIKLTSPEALTNDPLKMQQYKAKQAIIDKQLGVKMRQLLSDVQQEFKDKGMLASKEDISLAMMQYADTKNNATGINLAGFILEKDGSGISLANSSLMKEANTLYQSSLRFSDQVANQAEAAFQKKRREDSLLVYAKEISVLSGMTDQQKEDYSLKNLKRVLAMKDSLDPGVYVDLVQAFRGWADYQPPKSDGSTYWIDRMDSLYLQGKLTKTWLISNESKMNTREREKATEYYRMFNAAEKKNKKDIKPTDINSQSLNFLNKKLADLNANINWQVAGMTKERGTALVTATYFDDLKTIYERNGYNPLTGKECVDVLENSFKSVLGENYLQNNLQQINQGATLKENTNNNKKKIVRTGIDPVTKKKVVQYSDGSIDYVK